MKIIKLTIQDNGAIINADSTTAIIIRLEGNPTTGYRWEMIDANERLIRNIQTEIEHGSPNDPGTAGVFVFRLSGLAKGSIRVALKYIRPWEKATPALQQFEITLNVS